MRFQRPWLDRAWLVVVAVAFAIGAPIWLILMGQRFGWRFVLGGVALAIAVRYATRSSTHASTDQSSDRAE